MILPRLKTILIKANTFSIIINCFSRMYYLNQNLYFVAESEQLKGSIGINQETLKSCAVLSLLSNIAWSLVKASWSLRSFSIILSWSLLLTVWFVLSATSSVQQFTERSGFTKFVHENNFLTDSRHTWDRTDYLYKLFVIIQVNSFGHLFKKYRLRYTKYKGELW